MTTRTVLSTALGAGLQATAAHTSSSSVIEEPLVSTGGRQPRGDVKDDICSPKGIIHAASVEPHRLLRPEPTPANSSPRLRQATEVAQPIIFITRYSTLLQHSLASAIDSALAILVGELHRSDGPLADEAIVFYYGWHGDAALIDIAVPAKGALERRRDDEVRTSILPASKRCIVPAGGISGLRAARRRLRLAAGAEASDQLFRVWQRVPLIQGKLPEAWLSAPVYGAG